MYSSHYFQKVFWVDDKLTFKCCPLNDDLTGDFDNQVNINPNNINTLIKDIEDVNLLLDIQKGEILNQLNYNGSLNIKQ